MICHYCNKNNPPDTRVISFCITPKSKLSINLYITGIILSNFFKYKVYSEGSNSLPNPLSIASVNPNLK